MKYDYHIIVIGAGSAGLVVASGAAGLKAKVALIEKDKMGGDCLNYGCIPSKTLLKSGHVANVIQNAANFGINTNNPTIDIAKITQRIKNVISDIAPHDSKKRYEGLGVTVYTGLAKFVNKHEIAINGEIISAANIVIATGSYPVVPKIPGLDQVNYYTNETIFDIKVLPQKLIVLGAGPIGCELGQAFANLNSEVTLVDMAPTLFSKDEPEVSAIMQQQFKKDRIKLALASKIIAIDQKDQTIAVTIEKAGQQSVIYGDTLLLALGRKANIEQLDLAKVNVKVSKNGQIITNNKLQTSEKNIYACGDVTSPYAFTHMAGYHASIVVQNIIFPIKKQVDYTKVPWVTYTLPEVAHIGYTEQQLIQQNIRYKKYFEPLKNNDRSKTAGDENGFLKILTNHKGVMIGATMVSNHAGEEIMAASIAINKKMKLAEFASIIVPYPTESEIYKTLGFKVVKEGFTPWKQKLVQKLFLSQRNIK